jgi:DNA-binding HxlR family transcriptional regulator
MDTKRTYGDPCGVARALDRVGERWALLVVRELLIGPKRFTDLRAGLPRLSPDILSERLRELEQSGVLRRSKLPPPAGSRVYELTEWGRELEPVVLALGGWGSRAPFPAGDSQLSPDALMIALKTVFDPSQAPPEPIVAELKLGGYHFRAQVADGRLEIVRADATSPDATIECDPATLADVLWHGGSLDDPKIKLDGDPQALARFLALFATPRPVAATG